ncbi:hypothetical protein KFZ56_05480 [Virgibacillus sp. NKC19-3]|uniref:hypothetical protein n=1 Tax=Virgibacillus saliphilus TaxID=2831674 RepID=UPI001C9A8222|nr:hypothetical protein [Virgibacillus sp. NKC19-3]MBY7142538.1 hypothetical protein [Virgibacillus sp. NKC19-3]
MLREEYNVKIENALEVEINNAEEIQRQRMEWRRKSWTIPDLRGGKHTWFSLVVNLVKLVESGQAELDVHPPNIHGVSNPQSWRIYASFLKGLGLVNNQSGSLYLSETGLKFHKNPTKIHLAELIQDKLRLFGEVLKLLSSNPSTVANVNEMVCKTYGLNWRNLANTRKRMDWLEILGLIEDVGSNRWAITTSGRTLLEDWCIVTPNALETVDSNSKDIEINETSKEIAILLQNLRNSPEMHRKRKTYNIWAPSPNRIDNLRIIIQAGLERINKSEFFQFIEEKFSLKTSSVESMLPFLKASGLLKEVRRNVYSATSAAKAWIETGNDLDFIRILHAHMQFVGEIILAAEKDTVRNDIYSQATLYGLNKEKTRWIIGFLLEAGLLDEPQYLHLKATPTGLRFVSNLPLARKPIETEESTKFQKENNENISSRKELNQIIERLANSSRDPIAEGKQPGAAFEESIAEIFCFMGLKSERIGGAGDTDVVVRWQDEDGNNITAIVDGKSKSSGKVSHSDISDVAIETHKDLNDADYVAIIGPGFSGDTIRSLARKKDYVLVTNNQLSEIALASDTIGLSPQEVGLIFQVPKGLSKLDELIITKQRKFEIISIIISRLNQEQEILGGLSARDIFFMSRTTSVAPSLEELLELVETLSKPEIGAIYSTNQIHTPENTTYVLGNAKKTANRLRALASTIDVALRD